MNRTYHLIREGPIERDEIRQAVVIAGNELLARTLVAAEAYDEGPDAWFTPPVSNPVRVVLLGEALRLETPRVVCLDVLEGG